MAVCLASLYTSLITSLVKTLWHIMSFSNMCHMHVATMYVDQQSSPRYGNEATNCWIAMLNGLVRFDPGYIRLHWCGERHTKNARSHVSRLSHLTTATWLVCDITLLATRRPCKDQHGWKVARQRNGRALQTVCLSVMQDGKAMSESTQSVHVNQNSR